jgi:hypothetical protein
LAEFRRPIPRPSTKNNKTDVIIKNFDRKTLENC